jgi:cytochrome P450 family 6
MELNSFLIAFSAILISYYFYKFVERQKYFIKHKIPFAKSDVIWGSTKDMILGKSSMFEGYKEMCEQSEVKNSKFFGFFLPFGKPGIVVSDSELLKRILVKDFNSFSDRLITSHKGDPLGYYNMFSSKGLIWKKIRSKFSPFFSSGKIKMMFYLVDKTGDELVQSIERKCKNNSSKLDLKDILHLCTTDIIARCAFGVEANSLENPNAEFCEAARAMFTLTFFRKIEMSVIFFMPQLFASLLNIKMFSKFGSDFIIKMVKQVMEAREKSGIKAHDLIDTLIELKNTNEFESIEILIAQAAVFFSAGHETTSTSMTLAVYELAMNQDVQIRLREEIKEKLSKNEGKVTYDSLSHTEMPYLHQIAMETLRKYPVIPYLERMCVDPNGYSLEPESDFKIPFGMPIHIPIYPICRSEKFFKDPMKFDPDRFADNKVNSYEFMPFGTGPRNCIAERFALLTMKVGIVKILSNFKVESVPETPTEIIQVPNIFVIQSKVPIIVNFIKNSLF